ncbi:MAG TPA: ATP synthase F0 subunit B [Bryobacteraceae bacterium]|jgi:F0F1-type ATP synthase membrane subunit b/b'|nr:ATP synthase F0 subunit B [Bryobacteraceae bacterium]
MDATLHDLGGILLKAVPTIILLLIVHLYLKAMFFGPMRDVLAERREATEGARKSAEELLAKASEKAAALEAALRKAREEIYQEQEEARRRWISEQNVRLEEARRASRDLIHQAKEQLDAEAAAAKRNLTASTAALADQIATSLLEGKAA